MAKKGFFPNPYSTKRLEEKIDRQLDHDTRNIIKRRGTVKASPDLFSSKWTCDKCHKSECPDTYVIRDKAGDTSRLCTPCWKKRNWFIQNGEDWKAKKITTAYDKYFGSTSKSRSSLPRSSVRVSAESTPHSE